jgi:hemolysin III
MQESELMNEIEQAKFYTPAEERINILSHAAGLILSIVGLMLLLGHATLNGNMWHVVSFGIFGASLIMLYASSTFYHSAKNQDLRNRLRIIDHAAIYILIAGTYTPFALVTLKGSTGWVIFGVAWGLAVSGITLKLFFTGKYELLSTMMYVFMGWVIIFAVKPLIQNLSTEGIAWLLAGGIAYTVGAIIYSFKKIKFNHAIFHVFVLIGSISHFVSVYLYVLPGE